MVQLESFSSAHSASDASSASSALQSEYFDLNIGKNLTSMPSDYAVSDAPAAPAGVSSEAWSQISQMTAAGQDVKFTTAGQGPPPQYILGADGQLRANPAAPPSSDGSVTVQVEGADGANPNAAKKLAKEMEVAVIQSKIFYWQQANPGSTDIPQFLKGMLANAQSAVAAVDSGAPEAQNRAPAPAPERSAPQPQAQSQPESMPAPMSYGGGGSQRVGRADVGPAPSGQGYRPGSLEPNGPIDRTAIPKPIEGDLNIKGPPSANAEQIQTFLEKMGSPAAKEQGFSQALYDACTERGIDPAVAVGFFLQESTCGRYGRARDNNSLGNIKGRAPESGGTDGTFRRYDTWAEGARDWARLIDDAYVQKRGLTTLSQVIDVYAPSSDGNNTNKYVATVNGVVKNFQEQNRQTGTA